MLFSWSVKGIRQTSTEFLRIPTGICKDDDLFFNDVTFSLISRGQKCLKLNSVLFLVREFILAMLGWSLYFPIALKTGSVILRYSLSIGWYFGISMVLWCYWNNISWKPLQLLSSDTISFLSSKMIFLACLIDLFEKKGPSVYQKLFLLTSFGWKLFKEFLHALFRSLTQWLRCSRKFYQSDCFLDLVKVWNNLDLRIIASLKVFVMKGIWLLRIFLFFNGACLSRTFSNNSENWA